jgi:hypothetical protein
MNDNELGKFLCNAKKYAYSSGKAYSQSKIAETKEFIFEDKKLKYMDIYSGSVFFIGQEKVVDNNIPIWGMAYYGGILDDSYSTIEVYNFLRSALKDMPEDLPLRGKELFSNNGFTYKNATEGDMGHYIGYENIEHGGDTVYELHYSGGYIR